MSVDPCMRDYLVQLGACEKETKELTSYLERSFKNKAMAFSSLPLNDEPHIAAWREYIQESLSKGAYNTLQERLAQIRFPIAEGISKTEEYRGATLRGLSLQDKNGLILERPLDLRIFLHQTLAGAIPALVTDHRPDFIALVRALAHRNEPAPIPPSMGACIVKGFNNWDRIHKRKREWQEENPSHSDYHWQIEFQRILPQKELYQDTFIILSHGDYSGKTHEEMGLSKEEWRRCSFIIRREHESLHYLTLRIFGTTKNHAYDELLADYAGITKALGYYNRDWFLTFMGLMNYPHHSSKGRLENYLGDPPLSNGAFKILEGIVVMASKNVEQIHSSFRGEETETRIFKTLSELMGMSLFELASM